MDDQLLEGLLDVRVKLSFHIVLYLAADVFDDRVDELEAVELALEGGFPCFIEGFL
jgi:hypothetical protein